MITNEERRERRTRLVEALRASGPDGAQGVALLQGAPKESIHGVFRQHNDFMYLCGVETPHAYLAVDARDGTTHLFLPYQPPERREREGPLAERRGPRGEPERRPASTPSTASTSSPPSSSACARSGRPLRAGEGAVQSWDTLQRAAQERTSDPWDGRPDRHRWFVRLLRERLPAAQVHDLAPLLDELRLIKSPAELELLRRSGKLAGDALLAAMRRTQPGVMEYQLDAEMRFVYLDGGARDVSYRAIVAGGDNAWYGHYGANDAVLADGDLVLVDCGPDYRYYASDITRIWPVNGRYDPVQRELYGFIVEYHRALLRHLRPGVTREQVQEEAAADMAPIVERTRWSKADLRRGRAALPRVPAPPVAPGGHGGARRRQLPRAPHGAGLGADRRPAADHPGGAPLPAGRGHGRHHGVRHRQLPRVRAARPGRDGGARRHPPGVAPARRGA